MKVVEVDPVEKVTFEDRGESDSGVGWGEAFQQRSPDVKALRQRRTGLGKCQSVAWWVKQRKNESRSERTGRGKSGRI